MRLVRYVTIVTARFDGAKPGFQLGYDVSVRGRRRRACPVDGLEVQFRHREIFLCLIVRAEGCHHQFWYFNKWVDGVDLWFRRCWDW